MNTPPPGANGLNAILRPTRRRIEPPVDDGERTFITPARARLIRRLIEANAEAVEIVGAPESVTLCAREGCDGQFSRCYLPASRCRASLPP